MSPSSTGSLVTECATSGKTSRTSTNWTTFLRHFDATYVSGVTRPLRRRNPARSLILHVRRTPAMPPPPSMWNVHDVDGRRTYNVCEGWNTVMLSAVSSATATRRCGSCWKLSRWTKLSLQQTSSRIANGEAPEAVDTHYHRLSVVCNSCARNAETVARLSAKC